MSDYYSHELPLELMRSILVLLPVCGLYLLLPFLFFMFIPLIHNIDIINCAQISKRWKIACDDDDMWLQKCIKTLRAIIFF